MFTFILVRTIDLDVSLLYKQNNERNNTLISVLY